MPPRTEAGLLDALSAAAPPAGRAEQATAALAEAIAGLSPGWIALEGCLLPAEGAAPAGRIRHALLHPAAGIALLELAPGDIAPDAAGRLARLLDAAGFTPRFGGLPPILHLHVPQRMLPTLGWVIEEQFGRHPSLALAGGTAWVAAARRLLAGTALVPRPDTTVEAAGPGGWWRGGRLLAGIWGGLALLVGSLVMVLQLLGPPETETEFAAGVLLPATRPDPVSEPQGVASVRPGLVESPAWPEAAEKVPAAAPQQALIAMPPAEAATPPDPVAATPVPEPGAPVAPAQEPTVGAQIVAEPEAPELAALDPPPPVLLMQEPPVPAPAAAEPIAAEPWVPDPPAPAPLEAAQASAVAEAILPEPVVPEPQAMEATRPELDPPTPAPPIAEAIAPDPIVAVPQPANPGDIAIAAPAPMAPPSPSSAPVVDETGSPAPEAMAATSGAGPAPAATPAPPEREGPATSAPADHLPPPEPPPPATPPPTPPVAVLRPPTAPTAAPLPALVLRADEMLRLGDISAARRLYERAATAGNGQAALALGRTHDPTFLAAIHARGIQGDRATAIIWYRRALELGVAEAREPLARLGAPPGE